MSEEFDSMVPPPPGVKSVWPDENGNLIDTTPSKSKDDDVERVIERLRHLALTHYVEPGDPSICTVAADMLAALSSNKEDEVTEEMIAAGEASAIDGAELDVRTIYLAMRGLRP